MIVTRPIPRCGFSLLEVVLALGIFFACVAVLSQIQWNGTRAAVQSRLKGQALLLCETKLQEVVAGIEPLSDQESVPFEDDPTWVWSLRTEATDYPELYLVEVTVAKVGETPLGTVSQGLRRWMRDPNVFIEAAEQQAQLEAEQSSSSGSSSSSGGTQ